MTGILNLVFRRHDFSFESSNNPFCFLKLVNLVHLRFTLSQTVDRKSTWVVTVFITIPYTYYETSKF